MDLDTAVAYVLGLVRAEPTGYAERAVHGLRAMDALLARVGDPHRGLVVLHVAGSKGKGSTALYAEALARAVGRRVGTYTSPHLEHWTERYRVDGAPIAPHAFAAAVARLRPEVEALRADPVLCPSFFDLLTAAAFLVFRDAGVDVCVLETGLGGRLDATNVVAPAVTCITTIELEHTDKLGHTLEAIAAEKAGIVKPGVPCVVGALAPAAGAVVAARAGTVGAPLLRLGHELALETRRDASGALGATLVDGDEVVSFSLGDAPEHAAHNAALALASVRRLPAMARAELTTATAVLAALRLPGRAELLSRSPWVVVDAAHTAESLRALASWLDAVAPPRRHVVLSTSRDKPAAALAPILAGAERVVVTRADPDRSLPAAELARRILALEPGREVEVVEDPTVALGDALARLPAGAALCATGSVYLAGAARRVLRPLLAPG